MMQLDTPPLRMETRLYSGMPEALRQPVVTE
jgi:hypothetical protein